MIDPGLSPPTVPPFLTGADVRAAAKPKRPRATKIKTAIGPFQTSCSSFNRGQRDVEIVRITPHAIFYRHKGLHDEFALPHQVGLDKAMALAAGAKTDPRTGDPQNGDGTVSEDDPRVPAENDRPLWLIWSHEHSAWWKPNEMGYTTVIADAGRYHFDKALRICDQAYNPFKPWTQNVSDYAPHEVLVPSPELVVAIKSGRVSL